MKLHEMRETKKDTKEREKEWREPDDGDKYPHDVHVHLTPHTLKKMGAHDNVEAGDLHHMEGHLRIHRVEEQTDKDGTVHRHVHGHFERLGMERMPDHARPLREEILESEQKAGAAKTEGRARNMNKAGD